MSTINLYSKICVLLFALAWISSFFFYERIKKDPIHWDVVSYYGYLPAIFIYNDITLKFPEKDPDFFAMRYWPETAPNGGKVLRYTMGLSYLYAPFFFIGHWYAGISGEPQHGYSLPYQISLQIGALFYLLCGFIFLRKMLLVYFSDIVTSLTIFSIFFGTNLLFYATGGALMAHSFIFSISCLFLLGIQNWYKNPNIKYSILIGFTGGLLTLIRPTMILFLLIPLLWGITNSSSIQEKIKILMNNKWKLLLLIIFFILPGLPQLFYWKYITGDWLFYSYTKETFYFNNPHILSSWFSYRNGWLLYTPLMLFALFGFFLMQKKIKHLILPFILFLLFSTYLISSWWCWWYGGYGLRAYVDLYAILAFPLAAFYDFLWSKKKLIRATTLIITIVLVAHNIFQEWQFEKGLLHFAAMTKKSYWLGFLKTDVPGVWWRCLQDADIENAQKGLPEYLHKNVEHKKYDLLLQNGFEQVTQGRSAILF